MGIIRGERVEGRARVTLNGWPLPWGLEVVKHSPTGLEWGYRGSGPAELALAILLAVPDRATVVAHYQRFKESVVELLPAAGPWTVEVRKVRAWLEMAEAVDRR